MEIIHENNGWTLYHSGTHFYILKKNQYFTLPPQQLYHFTHTTATATTRLKPQFIHLGEYKPTCADSAFFSALPLVYNNHTFFVNTNTQIVYITPPPNHNNGGGGIPSLQLPQTTSYNFNLCGNYKFAGMYHPYTNATSHFAHKTFLQFISPLAATAAAAAAATPPTPPPTPIRNNITFIIPFIHTTNTESLNRTITSLQTHVAEPFTIVILTPHVIPSQYPPNIQIVPYTNYVGHLGFENRLNILMNNKYDRATFYNSFIATYGKLTPLCAIWEYNWLLEKWHPARGMFKVPNFYQQKDLYLPSPQNTGKVGALLHGKTDTYSTTPDQQDTALKLPINHEMVVKGIYTPHDARDWQNLVPYGNLIEMKQYFATPIISTISEQPQNTTSSEEPQNTTISEEPQSSTISVESQNTTFLTISEEPQNTSIISTNSEEHQNPIISTLIPIISTSSEEPQILTISEEPQIPTISEEPQSSLIISTNSEEPQNTSIISTISEEPQILTILSTISEEPQNPIILTISGEPQNLTISEEPQIPTISGEPQNPTISGEPQNTSILSTNSEEPQNTSILSTNSEEPQNTSILSTNSEEPQNPTILSTNSEEPQNPTNSEEPQSSSIISTNSEEPQNPT